MTVLDTVVTPGSEHCPPFPDTGELMNLMVTRLPQISGFTVRELSVHPAGRGDIPLEGASSAQEWQGLVNGSAQ